MKKQLVVLAALVVIFVCLCLAIVYSSERKTELQAAKTSEVQKLTSQLKSAQDEQKLHDATNTKNLQNAGAQIITLNQQKATLCTQIKTARLIQPLCNQ